MLLNSVPSIGDTPNPESAYQGIRISGSNFSFLYLTFWFPDNLLAGTLISWSPGSEIIH